MLQALSAIVFGASVSPQVAQFLARVATQDGAHKAAYTGLIKGLSAAGIWPKLDFFYVIKGHEEATAYTNLVSSSYTITKTGSPTFAADVGITGINDVNAYLDTTFNPTTAIAPKFLQDSGGFGGGVSAGTKAALDQTLMGNSGLNYVEPYFAGDGNTYWRAQQATDIAFTAPASLIGHWAAIRTGVNAAILRKDAVNISTSAAASVAIANTPFLILKALAGGEASSLTVTYAWAGGGISAGDADTIATLMTSFFP